MPALSEIREAVRQEDNASIIRSVISELPQQNVEKLSDQEKEYSMLYVFGLIIRKKEGVEVARGYWDLLERDIPEIVDWEDNNCDFIDKIKENFERVTRNVWFNSR